MTDSTVQPGTQEQQKQAEQTSTFTPITSQDDLNRILGERLARERAKFDDYDDLKAKASRLDEIEDANKSEIEKAREEAEAAKAEAAKTPALVAEALRTHLVRLHEISDDDAELFLTATDPDLLQKQVDRLVARTAAGTQKPGYVPSQGTGDKSTRVSSYEAGRERAQARYQSKT